MLSQFSVFGFSGSRSCQLSVSAAASLAIQVRAGSQVVVGCARGVDQCIRQHFPAAQVFTASGQFPGQLAARSAAMVRQVVSSSGLLVAFPASGSVCPAGVRPGAAFSGGGSGTWASVALAVQLGGAVLVWASGQVPVWLSSRGSYHQGFWFVPAVSVQGSLF